MPICKNCHREITKFDNDICPYCGEKNPIPAGYQTMDMTQVLSSLPEEDLPKTRKRKTAAFLCFFLGIFGAHFFYLFEKTKGLITIAATLFLLGGVGTILYFLLNHFVAIYPILLGVEYLFFIAGGIYLLKKESPKDGHGEFLR
ncbi:MAG: hypothetical protein SPG64_02470 [Candidatus Enteromonas sp.]|nr:hypothetical protein [Candidatus Enteromonas sp.]